MKFVPPGNIAGQFAI